MFSASTSSKACCTSWSIVVDISLPEPCSATMMGDFPVGDFRDVWAYPDFARGMRKSEGDQHTKGGGLIVDLGWVATGCVSSGVLPSNIGSRADPKNEGPKNAVLRRFLRGIWNDDKFCRRICGRLHERRVSASQLPNGRLFLRVGSGWRLERRWSPLYG